MGYKRSFIMKSSFNTKTLTGMAMLSALSIVSLAIGIQFPFPFTPSFMLYDVADVFINVYVWATSRANGYRNCFGHSSLFNGWF